jgi:hypothetical protein
MTGKELIEAAARRAVEQCPHAEWPGGCVACAECEFAPCAELIDAARERVDNCPNCMGITAACSRCVRMAAALAEVEKMGAQPDAARKEWLSRLGDPDYVRD